MSKAVTTKETPLAEIAQRVKALVGKITQAEDKRDQYIRTAAQLLADARPRVPSGGWEKYLKQCGIGSTRASELLRIADGRTTVEEVREQTRERMQKNRVLKSKSPSRDGGSTEPDTEEEEDNTPEDTKEQQWSYSIENLCGDIIAREALFDKLFEGWKKFDCPPQTKKLLKDAITSLTRLSKIINS